MILLATKTPDSSQVFMIVSVLIAGALVLTLISILIRYGVKQYLRDDKRQNETWNFIQKKFKPKPHEHSIGHLDEFNIRSTERR